MTPLQVVYAVIAATAVVVGIRLWMGRRNERITKTYLQVFKEVQSNCITAEPFFRYLCHLKSVMATRSRDEVLHFDTAPEKLLESYIKQQTRNADPEYKLFDERLCWQRKTFPPTQINLPAPPWMNEFVRRMDHPANGPASVAHVVSRIDDAIDCLRDLPRDLQVVPGISADGKVGVHLQERTPAAARLEYARGYLVLAALWCLHAALLLTHGRTWHEVFAEPERIVLGFGPPLAGYALMMIAVWLRPVMDRAPKASGDLQSFLVYSAGARGRAEDGIRANADMGVPVGR